MHERIRRVGSSTVIAAILALIITSIAAGAAGDFMVLGESNNSGTDQTTLSNAGLGAAFTLRTTNQSTNATGIFGWSSSTAANSTRGVYGRADGPNSYGVYAAQTGTSGSGAAVYASGGLNNAINAVSDSDNAILGEALGCTGFLCGRAGVWGVGVGLSGGVIGEGPLGVYGIDSIAGDGFGLYTGDDALVGGNLDVLGTCTGCTAAILGTNGTSGTLSEGDVVTALGVTVDGEGNLLVTVGPASEGDDVLGIVSAAVEGVQSGSEDAPRTAFKDAGSSVAAGATLRIITSGIVTVAAADASGGPIAAGDALTVSESAGKLAKAPAGVASSVSVGIALGTLSDGTVVLYLD